MGKPIERITMFKVGEAEDRKKILDEYQVLVKTAVKVRISHLLAAVSVKDSQPPLLGLTRTLLLIIYNSSQDGKPYILACEAGETGPDPRSKGWNIVARSTFAIKADMDYYDNECEAHKALKTVVKPLVDDMAVVWFESIFAE